MFKRYSGITCFLLNYVTCGIYSLFMWHGMAKNLNKMAEQVGEKKIMGFFPAFLLGFVTCDIYPIIWLFQFFGLMGKLNEKKNIGITPENTFLKVLMSFIPVYSFIWLANQNNHLVNAYENQQ